MWTRSTLTKLKKREMIEIRNKENPILLTKNEQDKSFLGGNIFTWNQSMIRNWLLASQILYTILHVVAWLDMISINNDPNTNHKLYPYFEKYKFQPKPN